MKFPASLSFSTCFLFTLLAATPFARADSFTLETSGSGISVLATLTGVADPYVAGAYDITSGSGTVNGTPITLVTPSGNSQQTQYLKFTNRPGILAGDYTYNNVIYTEGYSGNGLELDANGLLFAEPDDYLNIVAQGAYSFADDEIRSGSSSPLFAFSLMPVSATPEPSSLLLLGTGVLAAAAALARRRIAALG